MFSIRSRNRSLVTARIWSMTATTERPWHVSGTKSGGLLVGELESGITAAVRRYWLAMSVVNTRQGRVLRISDPSAGSSLTHQISPRRGACPGLGGLIGDRVELFFNGSYLRIVVRRFARIDQNPVPRAQLLTERGCNISGTFPGRNPADKLQGKLVGEREGHLSSSHIPILPYTPPTKYVCAP
jgi:hypothetical protein